MAIMTEGGLSEHGLSEGSNKVLLEAHTLSDISTIAPCRIMPSVWPVLVSMSDDFTICTSPDMVERQVYDQCVERSAFNYLYK